MRWMDSVMFSQDPLSGVYRGMMPCSNNHTTNLAVRCPAPPGTATPNDVEDSVQDLAHRVQSGSTDALRRRKQRIQTGKLGICEIGQVGSPQGQTPAILPANRPMSRFSDSF